MAALQKAGEAIGRFQVCNLMREQNLKAIAPGRFVTRTTDSNHVSGISQNLLKDSADQAQAAGEVIVGDITTSLC